MADFIRAGTSGYSYKAWRGVFYPADLAADGWLAYYATQLPAVEINNSFYRMPRTHVVQAWRDAVPDDFRFVLKASRRITHQHRLKNAEEATGYLLDRAGILGHKLGAVLFQLPPNMVLDLQRLQSFQALLPQGFPAAFEFRHVSWDAPEVSVALASHGHVRVVNHDSGQPVARVAPGDWAYLRLRAEQYTLAELRKWHASIAASGAGRALVFFKHEDAGAGPELARRFLALAKPKAQPKRATRRKVAKRTLKGRP